MESDAESNSAFSANDVEQESLPHSLKQRNRLKSRSNPSIKHTLSSLTDPEEVPLKQDPDSSDSPASNCSPLRQPPFSDPDHPDGIESIDSPNRKHNSTDRPQSVYASVPDEDSSPVLSPSFSFYDNIHGAISQADLEADTRTNVDDEPERREIRSRPSSIRFSLPEDKMQSIGINDNRNGPSQLYTDL